MNHRPQGLLISKSVTGFLQFKAAEGFSARTTDCYRRILDQWLERQKDVEVSSITMQQLRDYLNYMRTDYVPKRSQGTTIRNSPVKDTASPSNISVLVKISSNLKICLATTAWKWSNIMLGLQTLICKRHTAKQVRRIIGGYELSRKKVPGPLQGTKLFIGDWLLLTEKIIQNNHFHFIS